MKKVVFALLLTMGLTLTTQSCTNEETAEEAELFGVDRSVQRPGSQGKS